MVSSVTNGVPAPYLTAALNYFDGYHIELFHTNWTGRGGNTSSSTYNA